MNGAAWASAAEVNLYYDIHWEKTGFLQNNPLTHSNNIQISLHDKTIHFNSMGYYKISVFSLNGKYIETLEGRAFGQKRVAINSFTIAKGTYVIQLQMKNIQTRRLIAIP